MVTPQSSTVQYVITDAVKQLGVRFRSIATQPPGSAGRSETFAEVFATKYSVRMAKIDGGAVSDLISIRDFSAGDEAALQD